MKPKVILAVINAKFIHSSLALRNIRSYCVKHLENFSEDDICIKEFTINNDRGFIISELCAIKPQILAFSCYIWNIGLTLAVVNAVKKVLPGCVIILGGPEVAYTPAEVLNASQADVVVTGEGEEAFLRLMEHYVNGKGCLSDIGSIAFHDGADIRINEPELPDFDAVPFPYEGVDSLPLLANRIIYYETVRGCPFKCRYCVSPSAGPIRAHSVGRVCGELDVFLRNNVPQVKLIDRTFNYDKKRASQIWRYIIANDNGVTNFHFEICADLLDDDLLELLKPARPGLFQFEIGIQTTNEMALGYVSRKSDLAAAKRNIKVLKDMGNIHIHLDLIAGLPGEGYESFRHTFDDVYELHPDRLQLGFLKLLKGSGLKSDADGYGIVYDDAPPYEVLYTNDITYDQLSELKAVEEVLEIFFNSRLFTRTLLFAAACWCTPFDFYYELSRYWRERDYYLSLHGKPELYAILYDFCRACADEELLIDLLKYDLFMNGNDKNPPVWLVQTPSQEEKAYIQRFYKDEANREEYFAQYAEYDAKQLSRMCRIEKFSYDIMSWEPEKSRIPERVHNYVLFTYLGGIRSRSIEVERNGNKESDAGRHRNVDSV